jgi:NAD(P)-dependent dehydrogenase (short-subunit alcohol dehydrogenase family)
MTDVCAVVGMGPGVSMGVAQKFASEGYKIAMIARSVDKLSDYAGQFQPGSAIGYPADAADPASLESAFNQIRAEMGAPSVLVYNAAVINQGPPTEIDPEQLVADFRVNVAGALAAAQQVIPAMRQAGRGTILLTGGGLALNPYPDYCSLAVGKAGLRNLAFSLHDYLKPSGIHVATVTIAGFVQPGTPFAPDRIAETYWQLHTQPEGSWDPEIVYTAV